jgi:hypothetical protein
VSKSKEIRVNTLIIGAGRSGTTTLYSYLKGHSNVCFSYIKEVPYFSLTEHFAKGEKYYHSFFRNCEKSPVIASADTYLLMDYEAISRVHAYNPHMKILVMLREPLARAYSSYNYSVNFGHHHAYGSFLDSIKLEREIAREPDIVRRNNLGHFYGSLYYKHMAQWARVFSRDQMFLMRTHDLKDHPEKLFSELCAFLGIPPQEWEIQQTNVAAAPKNKSLEKLFMDRNTLPRKLVRKVLPRPVKNLLMRSGMVDKLHRANRKEQMAPPLSSGEKELAMPFFREDLQLLKQEFHVEF